MILLWGSPADGPLATVRDSLIGSGADILTLDQPDLMSSRLVDAQEDATLLTRAGAYPLSAITACYPRPSIGVTEPSTNPSHPSAVRHLVNIESRLWEWASTTPATVMNRPSPGATNSTKMSQTRLAQLCGLDVPATLVTTDVERLREFADRWQQVICKGAGGARTVVYRVDIERTDRMPHLTTCPTYFQAYIEGVNHRVHLVGEQIFTVAITSENTDYRYGGCEMTPAELPPDIAQKCRLVCDRLGLSLAGIDLIRTADGHWYFLEANTSPAFTFFIGHERVADAIADVLTKA